MPRDRSSARSTRRTRHTPEIGRSSAAVDADGRALGDASADDDGVRLDVVGSGVDAVAGDGVGEGRLMQPATKTVASPMPMEVASGVLEPEDRPVICPLW